MALIPARPWYVLLIIVILVIDGTNAAVQVVMRVVGASSGPVALLLWQAGVASTAWAAAWAAAQRWRFASGLAVLNGAVIATMLLRLPSMVGMELEAAAPLRGAAVVVFCFVLLLAGVLEWEARKR